MTFSLKEESVLKALNFDDYVSASDLSKHMSVSSKTVYRMVKKINEVAMSQYQEPIILAETGKGYKLSSYYLDKDWRQLFEDDSDETNRLLRLLFKYPYRLDLTSIMSIDYMSKSTVERHCRKMEDTLAAFQLKLVVEGQKVRVEGSEQQVRIAINTLFIQQNKSAYMNNAEHEVSSFDHHFIMSQLTYIETELGQAISYPYDVNLYSHLYMVMKRYREGNVSFLKSQSPLTTEEEGLMQDNQALVNLSHQIIGRMEQFLHQELHELEVYFLFQNIYAINLKDRSTSQFDQSLAALMTEYYILNFFSLEQFNRENKFYSSLYNDLYYHILPMIHRLKTGIQVGNSMLEEVKAEFQATFERIKQITERLSRDIPGNPLINEAEMGYLTLYFEKFKLKHPDINRVLLICSTGIGTSELLKIRLKHLFPTLEVVATMGTRQLERQAEILDQVDVVISTVRTVPSFVSQPVIIISPVLVEKDIQLIRSILEGGI